MVMPEIGTRIHQTHLGRMLAVTSGQVRMCHRVCFVTPAKKGAVILWRRDTAPPIPWRRFARDRSLSGSGLPRTMPMSAHSVVCSCSSAEAQVWVTTSLTSTPRRTGCRGTPSSKRPSRIASPMENAWAVAWTRRCVAVRSQCLLTFRLVYTRLCGGGSSMEASSTIHVPTCSSQMRRALLACRPPRVSPQRHHLRLAAVLGPNAAVTGGVEPLVVCLGTLAESSTRTTRSADLAPLPRQHRQQCRHL